MESLLLGGLALAGFNSSKKKRKKKEKKKVQKNLKNSNI